MNFSCSKIGLEYYDYRSLYKFLKSKGHNIPFVKQEALSTIDKHLSTSTTISNRRRAQLCLFIGAINNDQNYVTSRENHMKAIKEKIDLYFKENK